MRSDDCFTSWFNNDFSLAYAPAATVGFSWSAFQFEAEATNRNGVSTEFPRDVVVSQPVVAENSFIYIRANYKWGLYFQVTKCYY
jgi:hypothetical protein